MLKETALANNNEAEITVVEAATQLDSYLIWGGGACFCDSAAQHGRTYHS